MKKKAINKYQAIYGDFEIGDLVCFPEDKFSVECVGFISDINSNDSFDYYEVFWFDLHEYSEEMEHTLRKYENAKV